MHHPDACPYCHSAGNGEPCAPYCGATCNWCGEPSKTSICATCQYRYACEHDATPDVPPAPSLVEVVRAVTRRKKLGRV